MVQYLIPIIGTLIVVMLGFLLKMVYGAKSDFKLAEERVNKYIGDVERRLTDGAIAMEHRLDVKIDNVADDVADKVAQKACDKDMALIRNDCKDRIKELRDLTKEAK